MAPQPKLVTAPFDLKVDDPRPFPDSKRVIYAKNPLEVVICQVRFPPILRISSEPPADFQEALRKDYPLFREIPPLDIGTGLPPELSAIMGKLLPIPSARAYELSSSDGTWQVTLTQESIALSCKKYRMWEQFRDSLQKSLALLEKIYQPSFFTRIGLRYQDVISRYHLGLKDVGWSDLLSADLASEFHSHIASAVESTSHQHVLRLQGLSRLTLQHGLGSKDGDVCYIIDMDFYIAERTGVEDAGKILNYFNREAGRVFRWCIADRLHKAMEPELVR